MHLLQYITWTVPYNFVFVRKRETSRQLSSKSETACVENLLLKQYFYDKKIETIRGHCQYLNNCTLTPPLTQQQSLDDKLALMFGEGRSRCAVAKILILIHNRFNLDGSEVLS